jgi:hypothetical protein
LAYNSRRLAGIAVNSDGANVCDLLMAKLAEVLAATLAVSLGHFSCVDLLQSDRYLLAGPRLTAARGQGVAVADANEQA